VDSEKGVLVGGCTMNVEVGSRGIVGEGWAEAVCVRAAAAVCTTTVSNDLTSPGSTVCGNGALAEGMAHASVTISKTVRDINLRT
jgi:hypothetical protein